MFERVESAFWPDFNTQADHLNGVLTVYCHEDDVEAVYTAAMSMRTNGLFTGFVGRGQNAVKIQVVGPYEPRRDW